MRSKPNRVYPERERGDRVGRRGAFTLVELLVVVAIIAVLISILLPALGKARGVSRATQCLSNQRQIGTALTMYCGDYNEWVPREGTYNPNNPPRSRDRLPWAIALRPYLDENAGPNEDLVDNFENAPYYRDPARPPDNHRIHYVNNGMKFVSTGVPDHRGVIDLDARRGPTPLSRHERPAETIYLTCFNDDEDLIIFDYFGRTDRTDMAMAQMYDLWHRDHVIPGGPTEFRVSDRIAPRRHGDGANAVFIDGHARFAPEREMIDPSSWDDGIYQ